MIEQKKEGICLIDNGNKNMQEYTEDDLRRKIDDLGAIEEVFFGGDGEIGGESKDTTIDSEFEKRIKEANDIKTKIEIVESLCIYFINHKNLVGHKKWYSKYIDRQDKENISEIEKKIEKILSKYPEYREVIMLYIRDELSTISQNVSFCENEYRKTQDERLIVDIIPGLLKSSYEALRDDLDLLVQAINYVEENDKIKGKGGKAYFLSTFVKHGCIKSVEYLDEIMNFKFYNDGCSYNYGEGEVESCSSDSLNLINLTNIKIEDLREINTLYSDGKFEELVGRIDRFPLEHKNCLLEIKNLRKAYSGFKKNLLTKAKQLDLTKQPDLTDCLLYLSNIKDNQIKSVIETLIFNLYSSVGDFDKQCNFVNNFIEKDLKKLLPNSSLSDGYSALKVLKGLDLGVLEDQGVLKDLKGKINQACNEGFSSLKEKAIKIIEEKINRSISRVHDLDLDELRSINREIFNLIEKKLVKVSKSKNPENGKDEKGFTYVLDYDMKDTKNVEKFLENCIDAGIDDKGGSERSVRFKEPRLDNKKEPQLFKEKKQEMQSQLDKVGLKVNVTDDGRIVGKNGEEFIKQNVGIKGRIEVNANGELILINSLGYRMRYQNNPIGLEKFLENLRMFDYINKIGLGYFGSNFRHMLESIKTYLPNQASYLSIDENNGDFLSIRELNEIVIPIFKNVGFIDDSQNLDYLAPDEITDTVMSHRLSKIEGGNSFRKGSSFNKDIFGKLLQQKNKV